MCIGIVGDDCLECFITIEQVWSMLSTEASANKFIMVGSRLLYARVDYNGRFSCGIVDGTKKTIAYASIGHIRYAEYYGE